MPVRTVVIPARFCGPPTTGNGGYTCALVASELGGTAQVTLRKPIPIERPLEIVPRENGAGALLKDAEALIAEGEPIEWQTVTPSGLPALTFAEAIKAAERSPAFRNHPFPTCFVCGPQRAHGDGLRIFPGRVEPSAGLPAGAFAAPWIPDASLPNANGIVHDEFIWAALDCPTGFACDFPTAGTLVTGRLAAKLFGHVHVEEKCVLLSWPLGVEGRKHHAAAVLLGEDASVRAEARATWIKLG
jgi:hypothetical protein